jgi:hypothetical protein
MSQGNVAFEEALRTVKLWHGIQGRGCGVRLEMDLLDMLTGETRLAVPLQRRRCPKSHRPANMTINRCYLLAAGQVLSVGHASSGMIPVLLVRAVPYVLRRHEAAVISGYLAHRTSKSCLP